MSAGNGSKGPRLYNWAVVPLKTAEIAGWSHSLVIRQSRETGEKAPETAYVLVFAPTGTTLKQMVEVIGDRWTVEECFKSGKGQVGLDEYEVRNWQGLYRHITLCMFAMAFLAVLCNSSQALTTPTLYQDTLPEHIDRQETCSEHIPVQSSINPFLPIMVPFSIPEIKRLFYYLVSFKPLPILFRVSFQKSGATEPGRVIQVEEKVLFSGCNWLGRKSRYFEEMVAKRT